MVLQNVHMFEIRQSKFFLRSLENKCDSLDSSETVWTLSDEDELCPSSSAAQTSSGQRGRADGRTDDDSV